MRMKNDILKRPRDGRLDSLRGLFLVIMTLNHLDGTIAIYTYETFGFVSAAAGFVLLSGYMYGMQSGPGPTPLSLYYQKAFNRVRTLYGYHLCIALFLFAGAALNGVYAGYWGRTLYAPETSRLESFFYTVILWHKGALMDILPMYISFLLLTPFVQYAFARNKSVLALSVSATFWFVGQYADPFDFIATAPESTPNTGLFNLFSWQLLWVSGLYAGYLHGTRHENNLFQKRHYLILAACVAIVFFLIKRGFLPLPEGLEIYFDNGDLRILRLLNILALVMLMCWLIKLLPISFRLPVFSTLGRYSLQVLAFHLVLLYLLRPVSWRAPGLGLWAEVALSIFVVLALWGMIPVYEAYVRKKKAFFARRNVLRSSRARSGRRQGLRAMRERLARLVQVQDRNSDRYL
jgi:hypothetical protein